MQHSEQFLHDWQAWWAGELERPLVIIPDPGDPRPFLTKYGLEASAATILDAVEAEVRAQRWLGDGFRRWWPNYGAGSLASYLGSAAEYHAEGDTVWFHELDAPSLDDIALGYDADNPWWQQAVAVTRGAVERWGDDTVIAITDLGGNLDILASMRGTANLLTDLIDAPDVIEKLTQDLTRLWLRYYDELYAITAAPGLGCTSWAAPWYPATGYMLQCDFSYMISPRMFERFVLPDLEACCAHLEYGFYHLDGKGQIPHLEMLLGIERLRGIQWIPGAGQAEPEGWLPLLKRIRQAGKLVQLYVSAEGALTICRELGGRGFLFQIDERPADVDAYLEQLQAI